MSLNKNIKVKLPDNKWVLSKPNKSGDQYVMYLTDSTRVSKEYVKVKRVSIGIYDKETKMLIPNNKYYEIFDIPSISTYSVSTIRNYGNYYLMYYIFREWGLLEIIRKVFPTIWDKIITISMYMICDNEAMYYIDDYCDENYLINNTYVTSSETSKVFTKITPEKRQEFLKLWIKARNEQESIAYDVTSISSYTKEISLLDYGYNRDKEDLPQINLGMYYGMTSRLPLLYEIYNGALTDKVHFDTMLRTGKAYGIDHIRLIMDRGFFTQDNIEYLYNNNIPFIMGISISNKEVKKKIDEIKERIKSSQYSLSDDLTNGISIDMELKNIPVKLHLYYNHYKVADEITIIKGKICRLEQELKGKILQDIVETKRYEKYFKLEINKGQLISYTRDYEKIDKIYSYAGYYALISNGINDNTEEILKQYRGKDIIEKTFDNLKNYIDCNRLRVHYDETMQGKIFITFISLIIKSVIDNKITDMSVKKVINEMKKLKIQILANNEEYIGPLTKKQKDIIKQFNINEEELKKSVNQLPL